MKYLCDNLFAVLIQVLQQMLTMVHYRIQNFFNAQPRLFKLVMLYLNDEKSSRISV